VHLSPVACSGLPLPHVLNDETIIPSAESDRQHLDYIVTLTASGRAAEYPGNCIDVSMATNGVGLVRVIYPDTERVFQDSKPTIEVRWGSMEEERGVGAGGVGGMVLLCIALNLGVERCCVSCPGGAPIGGGLQEAPLKSGLRSRPAKVLIGLSETGGAACIPACFESPWTIIALSDSL
jgi:hypothetical protein